MLETLFLMPRLPRGGSDLRLGIVPLDTFITDGATTLLCDCGDELWGRSPIRIASQKLFCSSCD